MELIELKANIRKTVGDGPSRTLRREGRIPAVLYGPDMESVLLSVNTSELEQALKKSKAAQVLLNLIIQNGETDKRTAMIKEMQTHPVSGSFLHVDFYEIAMDRKIKVAVPVVTKGKSIGVELGGTLQIVRRELEVYCLPMEIPERIEIDISELNIGDSVHVQEIPLAGDVEFPEDVNFTVLTIVSPKKEEEPEEEIEEEEAIEAEGEETGEEGPTTDEKE